MCKIIHHLFVRATAALLDFLTVKANVVQRQMRHGRNHGVAVLRKGLYRVLNQVPPGWAEEEDRVLQEVAFVGERCVRDAHANLHHREGQESGGTEENWVRRNPPAEPNNSAKHWPKAKVASGRKRPEGNRWLEPKWLRRSLLCLMVLMSLSYVPYIYYCYCIMLC